MKLFDALRIRRCGALPALRPAVAFLVAAAAAPAPALEPQDRFAGARRQMIEEQIVGRGIDEPHLVEAMARIPRHLFVPEGSRADAYEDRAVPIGDRQNLLQPYMVAKMAELLELDGDERILEIGTGTGYQAAVLAQLAAEVFTVEIVPSLAARAERTLASLGYDNVHVRTGDGYRGWPEEAPFDAIVVTAASKQVPGPLREQLAVGGKLLIPVGEVLQDLTLIRRTPHGFDERKVALVRIEEMDRDEGGGW